MADGWSIRKSEKGDQAGENRKNLMRIQRTDAIKNRIKNQKKTARNS